MKNSKKNSKRRKILIIFDKYMHLILLEISNLKCGLENVAWLFNSAHGCERWGNHIHIPGNTFERDQ